MNSEIGQNFSHWQTSSPNVAIEMYEALKLIVATFVVHTIVQIASSETYFLSYNGSSSNNCTITSPCLLWRDVTVSGLLQDGDSLVIDSQTSINIDDVWDLPGIIYINIVFQWQQRHDTRNRIVGNTI